MKNLLRSAAALLLAALAGNAAAGAPELLAAHARLAFHNLFAIHAEANMTPRDIVRINAYVPGRAHLKP